MADCIFMLSHITLRCLLSLLIRVFRRVYQLYWYELAHEYRVPEVVSSRKSTLR